MSEIVLVTAPFAAAFTGLAAWGIYLRFLRRVYEKDGVEGVVKVATALPFRRPRQGPAAIAEESPGGEQQAA